MMLGITKKYNYGRTYISYREGMREQVKDILRGYNPVETEDGKLVVTHFHDEVAMLFDVVGDTTPLEDSLHYKALLSEMGDFIEWHNGKKKENQEERILEALEAYETSEDPKDKLVAVRNVIRWISFLRDSAKKKRFLKMLQRHLTRALHIYCPRIPTEDILPGDMLFQGHDWIVVTEVGEEFKGFWKKSGNPTNDLVMSYDTYRVWKTSEDLLERTQVAIQNAENLFPLTPQIEEIPGGAIVLGFESFGCVTLSFGEEGVVPSYLIHTFVGEDLEGHMKMLGEIKDAVKTLTCRVQG